MVKLEQATPLEQLPDAPIMLFDGVCNLCNGAVQFILKHERTPKLHFLSLQSAAGQAILQNKGEDPQALNSFMLFANGKLYKRSTAALEVARRMGGAWKLILAGYILPRFIRDALYDWVARNRYKWFGKQEEACWLPRPEWKLRLHG